MDTISLKIPASLSRRLNTTAKRRGVSKSAIVRESLEQSLGATSASSPPALPPGSILERVCEHVGSCEGPGDLTTNPRYMDDFGQ